MLYTIHTITTIRSNDPGQMLQSTNPDCTCINSDLGSSVVTVIQTKTGWLTPVNLNTEPREIKKSLYDNMHMDVLVDLFILVLSYKLPTCPPMG